MSLTQTYRVASTARGKLGMEAARADHNLRLLVGHANLLDSLMVELSNAEREQEVWFNNTIRNSKQPDAPKHIQWFDSISEELDEDDEDSDSESDSESDEIYDSDFPIATVQQTRRRSVSPPPPARMAEDEDLEDLEDFDSDSDELALERVPSHTPELSHSDADSESDDESMPPSPSHETITFDLKSQTRITEADLLHRKSVAHATPLVIEHLHELPLVTAISVY